MTAAWPLGAWAQQGPAEPSSANSVSSQLDPVTVTAQRRTENYKDVPISATVVTPEQLKTISTSGQDIRVLAGKVRA